MNKKNLLNILNYAKYVAFLAATVFVIVFQINAKVEFINVALACYVVSFGLMFICSVVHCVEIYKAAKFVKTNNAVVEDIKDGELVIGDKKENVEKVNIKSEKVWSVLYAVFFGAWTLFTFIVLLLF